MSIDALVAEKVMGWKPVWVVGYSINHFIGGHFPSKKAAAAMCNRDRDQVPVHLWSDGTGATWGQGESNFHPSTDPAAAWQVVEKMRANGWGVDLFSGFSERWQCEFGHPTDRSKDVMMEADTMPEAVCRAALAALEAQ